MPLTQHLSAFKVYIPQTLFKEATGKVGTGKSYTLFNVVHGVEMIK